LLTAPFARQLDECDLVVDETKRRLPRHPHTRDVAPRQDDVPLEAVRTRERRRREERIRVQGIAGRRIEQLDRIQRDARLFVAAREGDCQRELS